MRVCSVGKKGEKQESGKVISNINYLCAWILYLCTMCYATCCPSHLVLWRLKSAAELLAVVHLHRSRTNCNATEFKPSKIATIAIAIIMTYLPSEPLG